MIDFQAAEMKSLEEPPSVINNNLRCCDLALELSSTTLEALPENYDEQFQSTGFIELEKFRPAKVEDIASVHERAYVSGLEKAMDQASKQGLILIEGSGPTYATSMESLLAAGAGISLVDAVVMSHSKTCGLAMFCMLIWLRI